MCLDDGVAISSLECTVIHVRVHVWPFPVLNSLSRELECVPDIWSLIEWSNWLTPRNMKRRYDTVFYMCFVDSTPPTSPDGLEVKKAIVSRISA